MKCKGVITVFLALVFLCIVSLLFALVESARTAGIRYYEEVSANAAIDSVFSEYHNALWERYRLLLLYAKEDEEVTAKFLNYMQPYIEADSWIAIEDAQAEITREEMITGGGGIWLEQEILDYMRFGITEELFSLENDPETLQEELRQAETMQSITDEYAQQSKEAVSLEKCIRQLNDSIANQKLYRQSVIEALQSGSNAGVQNAARRLEREIQNYSRLVKEYGEKADALSERMAEIDSGQAASIGNLSEENRAYLNDLSESYRDYLEENGRRRKEIEAADADSERKLETIDYVRDESMQVYDKWSDEPPVYDETGKLVSPGVSYAAERRAEWNRLEGIFRSVTVRDLGLECGIADSEKEKEFEKARDTMSGDLLELLIPEGRSVSGHKMSMKEILSRYHTELYRNDVSRNAADKLLITEYIEKFFTDFTDYDPDRKQDEKGITGGISGANQTKTTEDGINESGTSGTAAIEKEEETHSLQYEMEYIIGGEDSDRENLSQSIGEIFLMREGLNYLHILRDSSKLSAANELSAAIVGGTGFPLLQPLIACLIIGVWAGAESMVDCRALLAGHKVPLVKTREDWKLGLENVLSLGKNVSMQDDSHEKGILYPQYLKFLLFLLSPEKRNYRMMDVIQSNIRSGENDFSISRCIYGLQFKTTCSAVHLFAPLGDFQIVCDAVKAY